VAVFSIYSRTEVRFVRAGTLDQPADITPDVHIFTRSKAGWVVLPDSVPAFEVYYDQGELWPAASVERLERGVRRQASVVSPSGLATLRP
jgi:hypothetical protein